MRDLQRGFVGGRGCTPYHSAVCFFQEGGQFFFFNYRKGLSETLLGHEITPCASYYLICACMQAHFNSPSRGRKLNSSESTIWQSNCSDRQYRAHNATGQPSAITQENPQNQRKSSVYVEMYQLHVSMHQLDVDQQCRNVSTTKISTLQKAQRNKYIVNLFKQSLLFPGGTGSLPNKHGIFPTLISFVIPD